MRGLSGTYMISTLHIRLLGDFQVSQGGTPLKDLNFGRLQSLLAFLLLHRDTPQPRSQIAFAFWPDSSEAHAYLSLRKTLHLLRRVLPDAENRLRIDNTSIQWYPYAPTVVDVADFATALARASPSASASEVRVALKEAVHHYGGDLLPGCYDEWVIPERESLRETFRQTLERLISILEQNDEYAEAINYAQRLLRHDPLREESYRLLMRLYAANGDRPAAIRVYNRCVTLLQRELDVEPGPATQELYAGLLPTREPSTTSPQHPEGGRLTLPAQTTTFIGREKELASASDLLRHPEVRLVSMTGAGGTGKTRLAFQIASDLSSHYPEGVAFVPLAPVGQADLVVPAIAQALKVQESAGQSLVDIVVDFLRDRRMLLVLDNFEHIIEAAPTVAELLARCPNVNILVTSRAILHLRGEHEYSVPPLQLPDLNNLPWLEELAQYEAISLFVERAIEGRPDFVLTNQNARTVAEICAQLDGLPLAIELVAARIKILSPQAILSRLTVEGGKLKLLVGGPLDLPIRQQALRNAIAWSYDLLSAPEQALFRRLGVFAGGCTIEAAEAIALPPDLDPLEKLGSLIDKSLLSRSEGADGESRFWMLATLAEYALERLDEHDEIEAVRRSYAEYYLALAEQSVTMLAGSQQREWLSRLEREHSNFRAALAWCISTIDADLAVRLSGALWDFWFLRGYLTESCRWLEAALALGRTKDGDALPDRARARALNGLAAAYVQQGEQLRARVYLDESLPIWRSLNDIQGLARALNLLGAIAFYSADYPAACELYTESLSKLRGVDEPWWQGNVLSNLGLTLIHMEDYDRAERFIAESIALHRSLGDKCVVISSLGNLSVVYFHRGDYKAATALAQEFLDQNRLMGDRRNMIHALLTLGRIANHVGDLSEAHARYAEGLLLANEISNWPCIVRTIAGFARISADDQQWSRAARLLGFVGAQRERISLNMNPDELRMYEQALQVARTNTRDAEWPILLQEGQAMTFKEVVNYALSD